MTNKPVAAHIAVRKIAQDFWHQAKDLAENKKDPTTAWCIMIGNKMWSVISAVEEIGQVELHLMLMAYRAHGETEITRPQQPAPQALLKLPADLTLDAVQLPI